MLLLTTLLACADDPHRHRRPDPPVEDSAPALETGAPPAPCPCPGDYDADAIEIVAHGEDLVLMPPGPARDELFVFLHGTGQTPGHHERILETAAYAGYRTIGLQYVSDPDMAVVCKTDATPDQWAACSEQGHQAKIYGAEYDQFASIADEDSVVGLLHARLTALAAEQPDAGWDAYVEPAQGGDHERYIHWDRIVLGGFSQGGGHAAFLGRDQAAAGVVLMSGPPDPSAIVEWPRPGATPLDRWYVFHHESERFAAEFQPNWDALGIPGPDAPLTLPDGECWSEWPAFDGVQRMISQLPVGAGCVSDDPFHGSMANDPCMNVADAPAGDPYALFRPYLYAMCRAGEP